MLLGRQLRQLLPLRGLRGGGWHRLSSNCPQLQFISSAGAGPISILGTLPTRDYSSFSSSTSSSSSSSSVPKAFTTTATSVRGIHPGAAVVGSGLVLALGYGIYRSLSTPPTTTSATTTATTALDDDQDFEQWDTNAENDTNTTTYHLSGVRHLDGEDEPDDDHLGTFRAVSSPAHVQHRAESVLRTAELARSNTHLPSDEPVLRFVPAPVPPALPSLEEAELWLRELGQRESDATDAEIVKQSARYLEAIFRAIQQSTDTSLDQPMPWKPIGYALGLTERTDTQHNAVEVIRRLLSEPYAHNSPGSEIMVVTALCTLWIGALYCPTLRELLEEIASSSPFDPVSSSSPAADPVTSPSSSSPLPPTDPVISAGTSAVPSFDPVIGYMAGNFFQLDEQPDWRDADEVDVENVTSRLTMLECVYQVSGSPHALQALVDLCAFMLMPPVKSERDLERFQLGATAGATLRVLAARCPRLVSQLDTLHYAEDKAEDHRKLIFSLLELDLNREAVHST